MNHASQSRRARAALAGGALVTIPLAFVPMSTASAAPGCLTTVPASTKIATGLCQVVFDEAGQYTFTAPAEITELAAVLVGGGAGGVGLWDNNNSIDDFDYAAYAGGGGAVIFADAIDFSAPLAIEVGAGGAGLLLSQTNPIPSDPPEGGTTSIGEIEAPGGGSASGSGPYSGNEKEPYGFTLKADTFAGHGGGAGGDADENGGGPGLKIGDISGINTNLFASSSTTAYGPGGTAVQTSASTDNVAGAGGGAESPENGGVGGLSGKDGLVILRYTFGAGDNGDEAALPETGAAMGPWALVGSLLAMVAGVVTLTRRKTSAN